MAEAADQRLARGEARPLDGIPIAVKDLYCTKGVLTTAGSHILDGFRPPYESTVTEKLWQAGCGHARQDQSRRVRDGLVEHDELLRPGRESVANSAATTGRWCRAARPAARRRRWRRARPWPRPAPTPAGSIRQPASFCGIVGLKPTYGRCSRWGVVAFASSLDQPGPMTRTVRDAAIMLRAMAGHDPKDSTSAPLPVPDYEAALTGDIRGLRIGIPREYRADGMPAEIEALWQRGAEWLREPAPSRSRSACRTPNTPCRPITSSPRPRRPRTWRAMTGCASAFASRARRLDEMYELTRAAGFGAEVRRRVLIGTYVLSAGYYDAYYLKAQRVRALVARDFAAAFERVDCILAPTAPSAAFAIGEKSDDPVAMYLNDFFTVPANLAGLPAISVPAGLSADGLPLGLQVIGRAFDEEGVLRVAEVLERAAGFSHLPSLVAGD